MPRVSRKEADQHREDVLNAASKLFLEYGIDGVSVPAVMAEAGLTHGGFYGHFDSKEALVAEACERAFKERRSIYDGIEQRNGADKKSARVEFIKRYTTKAHRDAIGLGCPAAAMCGDMARENPKGQIRTAFAAGFNVMVERLTPLLSRKRKDKAAAREDALAQIAMLVGAVVLSRSTKGSPVSDEIMQAVRDALLDT
ncbi:MULTISPECIES: TetR/AcrR family transcriptional regulator [unclassified Hyphomicrobium]|uniref:TetR/AcrR family transcriptional regulator n=1 Tax=unclassified Hyphomicrobium TaxID=2619925 RepID=UPI000213D658|nr:MULTISPECIES: TetR/AcrR family transcriptional regulator [unclassified Hyphomicrobium]CCB67491.1 putative transcriptional regulator, TetR family [Hyphomicrobium sp. MC1]